MRKFFFVLLLLFCLTSAHAETPLVQVPQGAKTVKLSWDYLAADEAKLDDFQLQRTAFDFASVPSGPYTTIVAAIPKTSREYVFTFQDSSAIEVGRKSYFVLIARKSGASDSAPSNSVGVEITAPTPPSPSTPLPAPLNLKVQ